MTVPSTTRPRGSVASWPVRPRGVRARVDQRPSVESLENRRCPSGLAAATATAVNLPVNPTGDFIGQLGAVGSGTAYRVQLDISGLLSVHVHASDAGADTRLSLLDANGRVLVQSEAVSPTNLDDQIDQHLGPGTYYLEVESLRGGGRYDLVTHYLGTSSPGQPIPAGQGPLELAVADLNHDGKSDVVTLDEYLNNVIVALSAGDGTFRDPVRYPVDSGPTDVIAVDLNGDGRPDLVSANQAANDLSILINNGDGTFQDAVNVEVGNSPSSLASADLNGDGVPDLVVSDLQDNDVAILLGRGDGTFTDAGRLSTGSGPYGIATGDFNGDGHVDLVVTNSLGSDMVVYQGQGDGSFRAGQHLDVAWGCYSVIAADFNKDGQLDLATASSDGTARVFLNNHGVFTSLTPLKAGPLSYSISSGDFNGDGNLDLAVCNYGASTDSVFLGRGDGTFASQTTLAVGAAPTSLAPGDFNGDGRLDLATAGFLALNVSVNLGNGDGSFLSQTQAAPMPDPVTVVSADVNGDGIPDLLTPNESQNTTSIRLGRGDGTFRQAVQVPTGLGPFALVVGDFNGDGKPDMAVVNDRDNTMWVYRGRGDGSFEHIQTLLTGSWPGYISAADLDHDGRLDIVVTNYYSNTASIFYGNGDGTFAASTDYNVGTEPDNPLIVDINGDGNLDILTPNAGTNDVTILLGQGGRNYAPAISISAGLGPWWVSAADLNHDGKLDLIISDYNSAGPAVVQVLLGQGGTRFAPPLEFATGDNPYPIGLADFNGDGRLDMVVGNDGSNDLSLLLGNGDGTFQPEVRLNASVQGPYGLVVDDFNGDGKSDVAVANYRSNSVTLLLGNGDGTFAAAKTLPVLPSKIAMAAGDFNDDGWPDLVVADPTAGSLVIRFGLGDGTFRLSEPIAVGVNPSSLVVGDFNGDGREDIAVTDAGSNDLRILLGLGDGTFQPPMIYAVGSSPVGMVAGDFNQDGRIDLAVVNSGSNDVSVLLGRGDGTLQSQGRYRTGFEPTALVAGDFNQDGRIDLVTTNRSSGNLTLLVGQSDGTFQTRTITCGGLLPLALAAGDFTGDGRVDLAILDSVKGVVTILKNQGGARFQVGASASVGAGASALIAYPLAQDGSPGLLVANAETLTITLLNGPGQSVFASHVTFSLSNRPDGLILADFNLDDHVDLVSASSQLQVLDVYLGTIGEQFLASASTAPMLSSTPIVADLNHDGTLDVVLMDRQGRVTMRLGRPGSPGEFLAIPLQYIPAKTFRDFTLVKTPHADFIVGLDPTRSMLWSALWDSKAQLTLVGNTVPDATLLSRMISVDVNHDGFGDLVLVDRGSNQVHVLLQVGLGQFKELSAPLNVGFGPTDVTAVDANHDGWLDLLVTNSVSGDVSVLYGLPGGVFAPEIRLRAGLSAAGTLTDSAGLVRVSADSPAGITTAVLDPSGLIDLVVVDRGTDRLTILKGTPGGGFADPSLATSYATGQTPTHVVATDLNGDGRIDLAVLNEGSQDVSIFLNQGDGTFRTLPRVDAGNHPISLVVRELNGDGVADLLLGNDTGDVLILLGNGDGTFQPYQRADRVVSLAQGDLYGNGQQSFVLSNAASDQLSVQSSQPTQADFQQGRANGLRAPGPVAIADLNGDGVPDLVVVNQGANDVLVYLGLGSNHFAAARQFYTGTAPKGLTIADLNGDGVSDLVVTNTGSNDVSILLGAGRGDAWTLRPGPRLQVGETPVATTVTDLNADGVPDIVCVNQGSNSVSILRGLGGGFFNDRASLVLPTGLAPIRAFVGHFDNRGGLDLAVLDSGSSDLVYYSNFLASATAPVFIPSGGVDPIAAAMGDYNHDGYSDLVIVHNGDSRINLFQGGASGLVLSDSVVLGGAARPTDLVISATTSGRIQLFVSAEGADQVIPVSLVAPASALAGTALSASTVSVGASSAVGATMTGGGVVLLASTSVELESEGGSSSQSTAANAAAAASSAGATAAQTTSIAMVVSNLVQPMIYSSMGSLSWLVDRLVQVGQVQVSDILPLNNSDVETVAVLLMVSSTVDVNGDAAADAASRRAEEEQAESFDEWSRPTASDRFLVDLGGSLADPCRNVLNELDLGRSDGWTGATDVIAMTVSGDAQTTPASFFPETEAERVATLPPAVVSGNGASVQVAEASPAGASRTGEVGIANLAVSGLKHAVVPLALTALAFAATMRRRISQIVRRSSLEDGLKMVGSPHIRARSNSEGRTSRRSRPRADDLPPWVSGMANMRTRVH